MSKLTFEKTTTIAEYKSLEGASTIEVVKNPNNDKLFFATDNGKMGAFSGELSEVMANPAMSVVVGTTGEKFWMLHKKQSNNVLGTL